jgi:CubicO group peptidase (beta-lactamase class C family)
MEALTAVGAWPVGSAAVGVVRLHAADQAASTVGPVDLPFAWASVTKLATALGVLVAVEEGTLDLDEPAGPPGATVRHLLAHASGLGPDPGPPLARPGVTRIYSNAGFQTLGLLLADHAGMPFREYLVAAVLEPLGMDRTHLHADAPGGAAAAGLVGPLVDLMALGRELAHPTLVDAETHRALTSVQFPGLSGVLPGFQLCDPCPWGLGPEIRGAKHPHWTGAFNSPATYGHFGRSGSFLWIDPVAGLLCAGLSDRPFGPWAATAWPRLADAILAEAAGARPSGGWGPSLSGGAAHRPGATRP